MQIIKKCCLISAGLLVLLLNSCTQHLESLNRNPNGADPETANPSLVFPTVLTETGRAWVNLGFGDISGVMQYTQKDGWTSAHNSYDWEGSNEWSDYYNILRNNQYVYDKAVAANDELAQGMTLVMKSMVFGLITDLYGDIPYTDALKGNSEDIKYTFPVYDAQQLVYENLLKDLEKANTLLSKSDKEYNSFIPAKTDVYYGARPAGWRKLANSLALRYYMRLSEKLPDVARAGIEKIVNNAAQYPVMTAAADDAAMAFAGSSATDSWPTNTAYDASDGSNFRRIKMCNTFVTGMQNLKDPRLGIWAAKVQIMLQVKPGLPAKSDFIKDTVINGEQRKVRYIAPDVLATKGITEADINQNPDYVGLPVALPGPQAYNLSPDLNQAPKNPHVSWLNDIYKGASGPLLKARLISAAEVNFIIAEAKAVKGWTNANAEQSYYAGIKTSFDAWGVSTQYADYIKNSGVVFNNTREQIMTQKWIANWSNATEAWFDFRRTGFPKIHGVQGNTIAPELPLRFYYPREEQNINGKNEKAAAAKLEVTSYSGFGADGTGNSPWSRMWVLQGTGKPW
ncbi:SusD/RagB family nutrient-binding outer membrane lipoprotein [Niabella drilacis]|uniref:Starch-binding associating with outer membrane n=1 Tax=Niabella drilacis (strain DSM 25811 / CCM 8410 / CCUG 62505 / LMG 26954 / E90) TaxID=1285928 RepID=A0A1G6Y2Q4_NIADE|nr:SusD/RagB family nutrient-binding outer membrane lipoprotein [Niabella drilacis]SDD84223.1 Starch-binding associating with outer membrane [Niabella drilacis]